MARGMNRRIFGPWSTVSVFTNSASTSTRPPFCSAFATAERRSFARCGDAACGVYLSIARASPTFMPRTSSATSRTLRGATRRKRRCACGPPAGRAAGLRAFGAGAPSGAAASAFLPAAASFGAAAFFSEAFFSVFFFSAMGLPRYFFGAGAAAPGAAAAPGVAATAFFSPVCPWKVRVGANSPSLWPTMFSVTNTGTNFRPLCTAKVWPTKSGRMVLRRDQVLMTDFLLPLFASSTFLVRCLSANGPFLIERAMGRSLRLLRRVAHAGAAPRDDELVGAAVVAGLEALGLLAPRAHRVRVALPRLALAAAVRVIDGVHGEAADGGADAAPPALAGLPDAHGRALDVGELADGGLAALGDLADLAGGHADLGVAALLRHELAEGPGGADHLAARARLRL